MHIKTVERFAINEEEVKVQVVRVDEDNLTSIVIDTELDQLRIIGTHKAICILLERLDEASEGCTYEGH